VVLCRDDGDAAIDYRCLPSQSSAVSLATNMLEKVVLGIHMIMNFFSRGYQKVTSSLRLPEVTFYLPLYKHFDAKINNNKTKKWR